MRDVVRSRFSIERNNSDENIYIRCCKCRNIHSERIKVEQNRIVFYSRLFALICSSTWRVLRACTHTHVNREWNVDMKIPLHRLEFNHKMQKVISFCMAQSYAVIAVTIFCFLTYTHTHTPLLVCMCACPSFGAFISRHLLYGII